MDEKTAKRTNLEDYLQHRSGYGDYRYLPRLSGATREEVFRRLKHL